MNDDSKVAHIRKAVWQLIKDEDLLDDFFLQESSIRDDKFCMWIYTSDVITHFYKFQQYGLEPTATTVSVKDRTIYTGIRIECDTELFIEDNER